MPELLEYLSEVVSIYDEAPDDTIFVGIYAAHLSLLLALWRAELAYEAGVDSATRKAAWTARNEALDRLAALKAG